MRSPRRSAAILIGGVIVLASCGSDDSSNGAVEAVGSPDNPRVIEIDMLDIRFDPEEITVADGETVRLVFTNKGKVEHDAVVGDLEAQMKHEEEMADMASGESEEEHGAHAGLDDEPAIAVQPGEEGEILYTFHKSDQEIQIGCHEPGHYEAGMIVRVNIT